MVFGIRGPNKKNMGSSLRGTSFIVWALVLAFANSDDRISPNICNLAKTAEASHDILGIIYNWEHAW